MPRINNRSIPEVAAGGLFYWLFLGQYMWLAWGAFVSGFESDRGLVVGLVVSYLISTAIFIAHDLADDET